MSRCSRESDIGRRLSVWHALSEVFLDTELQPHDYRWIAAQLSSSRFSPEELRRIFFREVAPAFLPNLMSVAGEWEPWSEADVRAIMLQSLDSGPVRRALRRLLVRSWASYLSQQWEEIAGAGASPPVQPPRGSGR